MMPNLPNLQTAVMAWSSTIDVQLVCKSQENYKTVESLLLKRVRGVIQPYSVKQLNILPEGQRSWKWITLHCDTTLDLKVDDIVILYGQDRYRVMGLMDFKQYGYYEYHLVKGYENL